MIDSLSVSTFDSIRDLVNETVGFQVWPAYWRFLAFKPILRPEGMPEVEEDGMKAICPMQPLLEHTVRRALEIPKYQKRMVETDAKSRDLKRPYEYICYAKIGCDGMYLCMKYVLVSYVCMYVCMDVHIYIYMYIYMCVVVA